VRPEGQQRRGSGGIGRRGALLVHSRALGQGSSKNHDVTGGNVV
jgi:hypothetical protein